MIEEGIRKKVLSFTGVGSVVGTRMSPVVLIQGGSLPAIEYNRVDGAPDRTLSGPSNPKNARFQFKVFSDQSVAEAKTIAKAINSGLDGFRGSVTGGYVRRASVIDDGTDMSEPELGLFVIQLEYSIWFKED